MPDHHIFTVGGTVQAGGGIYLPRLADDELLTHCLAGDFCYVLTARQMGKSSLMVRTAERLREQERRAVIIDLTRLGTTLQAEQWYLGLIDEIVEQLDLQIDYRAWWQKHAHLGATQRLSRFLREELLATLAEPLVIFIDEIDTTLSLPFSDDFFAAIRACYNARSTDPAYKRLSFVLLGVATPGDLIRDPQRTPFNIGTRIDLTDFTLEQALPLAEGFNFPNQQSKIETLKWVFSWTNGHPYLTQRLCRALLDANRPTWDEAAIAEVVELTFFGEKSKQDTNLQFVRDMLTLRSPDVRKVLHIYNKILSGEKIKNNDKSRLISHLKISGIVRDQNEFLVTRNRIYEKIFDQPWIKQSLPSSMPMQIAWAASIVAAIAIIIAGLLGYQEWNRSDSERAGRFQEQFAQASSPDIRLVSLAGIFQLADGKYFELGYSLFENMTWDEKISIFEDVYDENNQLLVAKNIYQHVYTQPPNEIHEEQDLLMRAIGRSIKAVDHELSTEIEYWVEGRMAFASVEYETALNKFNYAIGSKYDNPAILLDRTRVYIAQNDEENYQQALEILTQIAEANHKTANKKIIFELLDSETAFNRYWVKNREKHLRLSQIIEWDRTDAQQAAFYEDRFNVSLTSEQKLNNLAGFFNLGDDVYIERARFLFEGMPIDEQISLFKNTHDEIAQLLVARNVYRYIYVQSPGEIQQEKDALVRFMGQSVKNIDPVLSTEINYWVEGRIAFSNFDYDGAINKFELALKANPDNTSISLDLARAYVVKDTDEDVEKALIILRQLQDMNEQNIEAQVIRFLDDYALTLERRFNKETEYEQKIIYLNGLFTLASGSYFERANSLFNQLTKNEKLGLFSEQVDEREKLILARNVYQYIYTGEPSIIAPETNKVISEEDELMEAIRKAVENTDFSLSREIEYWKKGRQDFANNKYQDAINKFNIALGEDRKNAAIFLDIARSQLKQSGVYNLQKPLSTLKQSIELNTHNILNNQIDQIILSQTEKILNTREFTGNICTNYLLFHTFRDDNLEIYRMDGIEGQPGFKLYNLSRDEAVDSRPSRSPNDSAIVFQSNRNGNVGLYVSISFVEYIWPIRLTTSQANNTTPMYGPDNRTIVYQSDRNGYIDLFTIDQVTREERQITNNPADDVNGSYSPELRWLVFQSNRNSNWDIFILDTFTGNEFQLTDHPANEVFPAWSSNGKQIAFISDVDGGTDLFIIDITGENLKRITTDGKTINAVWSPEGNRIAYQSDRNGNLDIYSYDLLEEKEYRVTDYDGQDAGPTWDCGGSNLAFTSLRDGNANVFQVFWQGGSASNMTIDPATDKWPQWRPSNDVSSTGY